MKSSWRDRVAVEQTLSSETMSTYSKILDVVLESNLGVKPYRNQVLGYLRSGRYDKLLDLADSLGGTEYPSASKHYEANQLAALIKKVPFECKHLGIDPEAAALKKFYLAERRCRRYNLIASLEHKLKRRRASYARDLMRSWIRRVIGEKPNYSKIWALCDFAPGASVGVSGNATHLAAKLLSESWSVTSTALPYALAALRSNAQMWEILLKKEDSPFYSVDPDLFEQTLRGKVRIADYNKIALVPKTARVHRTIAVEPLLNGFLQKGVDVYLRRRLYRHGLDLKDQSRNQELARQGSIPGEDPYATIDLSEASDSISISLARDLLPPDWFSFLNSIRSPSYSIDGKIHRYEKFCSMGNGFCFPLETLIFASVCEAVYKMSSRETDYSVYGDDIIVRSSLSDEVLKLLHLLGFRHNPKKTFLRGPFRESCGADWFLGEDVRPVTVDSLPETIPEYYSLHNQTLRSDRTSVFFEETREFLRGRIPLRYRFMRPYKGNADSAFEVPTDLFMTSPHATWDRTTWSWKWKEMMTVPVSDDRFDQRAGFPPVLLLGALKGSSSSSPFTLRRKTRTRVRNVSHHAGGSTFLPSQDGRHIAPRWLVKLSISLKG